MSTMGDPRRKLIECMARGIAVSVYQQDGLETVYAGNAEEYADQHWQDYCEMAEGALKGFNNYEKIF